MAAEELTSEDIQFIKELREARNNQSITRRQALGLLAGAGIGAGAGAVGTQQVSAAADTTDSDGNVGLPNERVDVFADGVDAAAEVSATSVNTGDETINNSITYPDGTTITTSPGGNISVSDDGTQIVSAGSDLNFVGINVTDDGDGTVTIGDTIDMGTI